MDETQKRKISAKEFIQQNKKIGFIVAIVFLSIFIIYLAFLFFYTINKKGEQPETTTDTQTEVTFMDRLFPEFREKNGPELDENGLPKIASSTDTSKIILEDGTEDNSKLVQIEAEPVLAYTVFDKPTPVKKYIQKKPKVCDKKLEVVLGKDEESEAVKNFQNMIRTTEGFENTPDTGKLDEETRNILYIFQTRYANVLYKSKADPTPTRVLDAETIHFLNLLCNFELENKNDFINIPTLRYVKKETRQVIDYNIGLKQKIEIESKKATGTEVGTLSWSGEYLVGQKDLLTHVDTEVINLKNRTSVKLEKNVRSPAWNKASMLVYGIESGEGLQIKIYDPQSNTVKKLAFIPMQEWSLFWQSENLVGIYNKPTYLLDGIFLLLDTKTGVLKQVSPHLKGLSAKPTNNPDFSIVSTSNGVETKTLLMNNKNKVIGDLSLPTFAEKCSVNIVFDGVFCAVPKDLPSIFRFPDDWYKGKYLTSDKLVYKTVSGTSTKVISMLEEKPISVIDLDVEKSGIYFRDERDFSLYTIDTIKE